MHFLMIFYHLVDIKNLLLSSQELGSLEAHSHCHFERTPNPFCYY